jgi:TRAP-type C4-dicarboxylate transport system substrate-binding protein
VPRPGLLLVVLALAAPACSGSDADKAGGPSTTGPVVLTLANLDPDRTNLDSPDFAAAVERLSGGSLRIDVRFGWRSEAGVGEAEEGTVDDVRAGRVDLAVIPIRAWDRVGVESFRALLAPLLVDSLALEQRVIRSPLAKRMLMGVEPLGLVGVALLPGELRSPLGVARPLVGAADYVGATVGVRQTPVARATFRALRAVPVAYAPGSISQLDGAELGAVTIASNAYQDSARALTANVVFWPRAMTIVMNRDAFHALTPRQQGVLLRAGLEAASAVEHVIRHETQTWLSAVCRKSRFAFVHASPSDRAALRRAVAPVYDELEQDALTRELIAGIRTLRSRAPALATQAIRCPSRDPVENADAAALQGRWSATLTREELLASGVAPGYADTLPGSWTLELGDGRFAFRRREGGGGTGTYTVRGGRIRFVWESGIGIRPDEIFESRWSVYRDRLTFSPVPGRQKLAGLDVEPWQRVD